MYIIQNTVVYKFNPKTEHYEKLKLYTDVLSAQLTSIIDCTRHKNILYPFNYCLLYFARRNNKS